MTEHWSTTGRLRWIILPERGFTYKRALQQEWRSDDGTTEWRDVPVEE
jgi:hypothetical protein